jgi:hypothetical protein
MLFPGISNRTRRKRERSSSPVATGSGTDKYRRTPQLLEWPGMQTKKRESPSSPKSPGRRARRAKKIRTSTRADIENRSSSHSVNGIPTTPKVCISSRQVIVGTIAKRTGSKSNAHAKPRWKLSTRHRRPDALVVTPFPLSSHSDRSQPSISLHDPHPLHPRFLFSLFRPARTRRSYLP